jgi:hypothetical protein
LSPRYYEAHRRWTIGKEKQREIAASFGVSTGRVQYMCHIVSFKIRHDAERDCVCFRQFDVEMNVRRNISFDDEGNIVVETDTHREKIISGVVLLTAEQMNEAVKHGWHAHGGPVTETQPTLYPVRRMR